MENDDLYPELRDYIFQYCGNYFWSKQEFLIPVPVNFLTSPSANILLYKILTQGGEIAANPRIQSIADDGYDVHKQKIAEIIYREHRIEIDLNLCPACSKIARTPYAQQCRFCFHSWREA